MSLLSYTRKNYVIYFSVKHEWILVFENKLEIVDLTVRKSDTLYRCSKLLIKGRSARNGARLGNNE